MLRILNSVPSPEIINRNTLITQCIITEMNHLQLTMNH